MYEVKDQASLEKAYLKVAALFADEPNFLLRFEEHLPAEFEKPSASALTTNPVHEALSKSVLGDVAVKTGMEEIYGVLEEELEVLNG